MVDLSCPMQVYLNSEKAVIFSPYTLINSSLLTLFVDITNERKLDVEQFPICWRLEI